MSGIVTLIGGCRIRREPGDGAGCCQTLHFVTWRQPVDLVALLDEAFADLPALFAAGRRTGPWREHGTLSHALLADDPVSVVDALTCAIAAGATPIDLGHALAYAAALAERYLEGLRKAGMPE